MKYANDYIVTIQCEFIVNCFDMSDAVLPVNNVMRKLRALAELTDGVKIEKITCNEVREAENGNK